jgi:threonine dehydratase
MFYRWKRLKLIVEPTGALGAAAALEDLVAVAGRRAGVIVSGGDVDISPVSSWIAQS